MFEHAGGFVLGVANAARHHIRGYTTPRPFGNDELERSARYAISVAQRWQGHFEIEGKRVLEVGPGPDLGTGAVLLANGAASYEAVDAFPLADRDLTQFYGKLAEFIGPVTPGALKYTLATFPELPELDAEYDLIVSNAALEHIADIPRVFQRFRELAPAGAMCHGVDATTHMRPYRELDPLNILRYSQRTYRLLSFPGAPNRLRASDYADAAERAGFQNVRIATERVADAAYISRVRPRLNREYASRTDLEILTFSLLAGR